MIADQNVREQVLDITQSFLVQAPAGSGKTSLLVQRFLTLLANVETAPEEILAITFTCKAAAEMRDRIIDALHLGEQNTVPQDAYKNKLWTLARQVLHRDKQAAWELIDNPARLKIQTIDALCSSITTQMPIITNFGAQPQIDPNPDLLYQKAVDQLMQDASFEALNNLYEHLDNDRSKIKKLLVAMLQVREQWLPIIFNAASQHDIRQSLENALELTVEEALDNLNAVVPHELDYNILQLSEPTGLEEWLTIVKTLLTANGELRARVTVQQGFAAPHKDNTKEENEQLKARKNAMHQMLDNLNAATSFHKQLHALTKLPALSYTDEQWQVLDSLFIVLKILVAHLTTVFKDTGKVDFSAVTLAALYALGNQDPPSDLSLALDCKIRHILVDEFQDTSLSQYALLEKLTANWDPYSGKTIFLVGDPMQSIYRFRKAEVGLFLKVKLYGINAIKLHFAELSVNFRSSATIVSWINEVFSPSFPQHDNITYGAIRYMPAQAANSVGDVSVAVECHAVATHGESNRIIEIIQNVRRTSDGKTIAILVRAKKHLVALLPALRAANIAYQGIDIECLAERPSIQDLLALTRAILHYDDRIAWLAILRAPWCGLCLADLQFLAQTETTIWDTLNDSTVFSRLSNDAQIRVTRFKAVMDHSLQLSGRYTIDLQVQAVWQALGGEQCLRDLNAAQEAQAFFNLMAELAPRRELFKPDFLDQQLKSLYLQPIEIDPNAVQIMTMHKAKGLEFDIVILPSLCKSSRGNDQRLLLFEHRHSIMEYLLVAPIKAAKLVSDSIYEYLAWSEKQRENFELLRLLYVAATRARESIYCLADVAANKPRHNSILAKIWPNVIDQFQQNVSGSELIMSYPTHIHRLPNNWYAANPYIATSMKDLDIAAPHWQADWLRLVGIVVHRIFEQIASVGVENWDKSAIAKQLPIWQQHLRQLGLTQHYMSQAMQLIESAVRNTINDPMGAKILSAQYAETYSEWCLTVLDRDEYKNIVLDRVFKDHDGSIWIVDYKIVNDASEIAAAVDRYAPQLQKYAKAIARIRPGNKIVAGFYFPLHFTWCKTIG